MIDSQIVREFGIAFLAAVIAGLVVGLVVVLFLIRKAKSENPTAIPKDRNSVRTNRLIDALVVVLFLVYTILLSMLVIANYYQFVYGYDFSILDQVVWNSLHGRLLETSVTGLGSTWLGTHFAPLLVALVPLYALFPDARMLLIVEVIALASAVFPLYWFARAHLGRPLALVIVLVFFLFSPQHYVALAGFHDVVFAAPILALAAFFFYQKRWIPFYICLALSILVREEAGFIIIAFGLVSLLRRDFRLGVTLIVAGFAWLLFVLQFVIPFFSGRFSNYIISLHYAEFGTTPVEVLTSIIINPGAFIATFWTPDKPELLIRFLVPLAFLPLVGWEFTLLSLPTLGYLFLLKEVFRYSHHVTWIISFFVFGAVVGMQRGIEWLTNVKLKPWQTLSVRVRRVTIQSAIATLVLVASFLSYYFDSVGPFAQHFDVSVFALDSQRLQSVNVVREKIPAQASLLTTGGITSFLSHRQHLYYLPFIEDYRPVDYILIDTVDCSWCEKQLDPILASGYFDVTTEGARFLFAKRRSPDRMVQLKLDDKIALVGYSLLPSGTLRGGQVLRLAAEWNTVKTNLARYGIRMQLVDSGGHLWAQDEHEPYLPTDQWTVGESINDQYNLRLSSTMPPGNYQIVVALLSQTGADRIAGNVFAVTNVEIEKDKSSITASELQERFELENPFFVDMADLRLIGFKSLPSSLAISDTLHIGLFWRAREKPRGDYGVSVQLIDANGKVQLTQTQRPAAGTYPTTQWNEGEVLLDWHDLSVPSSLLPGEYTVRIVLGDSEKNNILGQTELGKISITPK